MSVKSYSHEDDQLVSPANGYVYNYLPIVLQEEPANFLSTVANSTQVVGCLF